MRALVLIALATLLAPAWAQWDSMKDITLSQTAARTVQGTPTATNDFQRLLQGRTYTPGDSLGSVKIDKAMPGPGPLQTPLGIDTRRVLPWARIAKSAAKALPLVGNVAALLEIAEAIRCREAPAGGAECDPGVDESLQPQWQCTEGGVNWKSGSKEGAADACAAKRLLDLNTGLSSCGWSQYSKTSFGGGNGWAYGYRTPQTGCGSQQFTSSSYTPSATNVLACPPVVVNGVTLYPVKGADDKCMTNVYSPASEEVVAQKFEDYGDKSKAVPLVQGFDEQHVPVEHPSPYLDPELDSVPAGRETTEHPDGSTTVKDTRYEFQPGAGRYDWSPRVTSKDFAPGVPIPPEGELDGGTTITGTPPQEIEIITCGLPGTPPCKIDEGGTPNSADIDTAEVDEAKGQAIGKINDLSGLQAPAWTWSFELPSGCSPVTVGPFAGRSVVVDLCEYQGMIHDLAALIWAAFTIWACVGMVGRTFAGS